jgi:predicted regulator of Ras-like GTPase activity (Roadblock/LC7/MglB family)
MFMGNNFEELFSLNDVKGLMLVSFDGQLLFKKFAGTLPQEPKSDDSWALFIHSLRGAAETEVFYEKGRIYIRKTESGYLFVITGVATPMALVRLNCDMLAHAMKKIVKRDRFKNLFRRN